MWGLGYSPGPGAGTGGRGIGGLLSAGGEDGDCCAGGLATSEGLGGADGEGLGTASVGGPAVIDNPDDGRKA